jgi:hypothetical protein
MPRSLPHASLALATLTLAASSFAPAQTPAPAPPATIPISRGTTLSGAAVALPDAVKGKVGVLVLGFTRPSQKQIQLWGKRLAAGYPPSSGVVFFEVPIIASAPKLMRPVIVGQMKWSVSAAEMAWFLPLTDDEQPWLAVTHYAQPDDAYILLIDGAGVVHWQTEGPVTDANFAELKKNIAQLKSPPAPMHDNQP